VKAHFPRYMDQVGENERGRHALLLLTGKKGWTHESLRAAAFDSFLPGFARLLPVLMADYDHLPSGDARRAALAGAITLLRGWDRRWGLESTPTTLAVFWGDTLWAQVGAKARAEHRAVPDYIIARCTAQERLAALQAAVDRLKRDFGDWHVAWGRVNRFQRLDDSIAPHFDDARPSVPVAFTSAQWGSLASFGARPYPNTHNYYGTSGNSFVAIVEFGPKVKAWAVSAGARAAIRPRSILATRLIAM
jgi:acyl-homoserine lactone acylase PvdQ